MVGGLMQCKDGYVVLVTVEDKQWKGLADLIGKPELAEDERFKEEHNRSAHFREANSIVQRWMIDHTMEEIFRDGQERSVAVGKVNSPQDLVNSPQLRSRGFFVEIEHPETGKIEYPSAPYKLSKTPWAVERPAPLLGQHNEDIYCRLLGYGKQDLATMRENGVI